MNPAKDYSVRLQPEGKQVPKMAEVTDEFVLGAYVEGNDLEAVAPTLWERFRAFAESGRWPSEQILGVEDRYMEELMDPPYLVWNLGLNLGLDNVGSPGWFDGVEAVVKLLQDLYAETGRDSVLFLCFRSIPWLQEHLYFVGEKPVDLIWLREAIERLTRLRPPR